MHPYHPALVGLLIVVGVQWASVLHGLTYRLRASLAPIQNAPAEMSVVVLLPIRGVPTDLARCVRRICAQPVERCRVLVIVESEAEPAADVVSALQRELPGLQLVVAGRAECCGQKNHNLLAGLRAAPDADIYVTVDAGILPELDWLPRMLAPFADSTVQATSTHQRWLTPPGNVPALVISVTHAYLMSVSALPGLPSAWGGSTAIRASALHEGGLARRWERAVVDDVVTTAWAHSAHGRLVHLPAAFVYARGEATSWFSLWGWLVRQCQFQFLEHRKVWMLLLAVQLGSLFGLFAGVLSLPAVLDGTLPPGTWFGLAALAPATIALAGPLRSQGGDTERSVFEWAGGLALLLLLSVPALIWAALKRDLEWSGIRYRLDRKGRVLDVEHPTGPRPRVGSVRDP